MKRFYSANMVCRRTRGRKYPACAWNFIGKFMGFSMMFLLVSCGEDHPKGLRLAVVQEMAEASDSRVTIIDFAEDPPARIELRVGESKNGIELIEVDGTIRTALIRRGGKEIRLKMGEGE